MSAGTSVVAALAGFFLLIAALTVSRLLLRRTPPTWRRLRVGVFLERDPDPPDRG